MSLITKTQHGSNNLTLNDNHKCDRSPKSNDRFGNQLNPEGAEDDGPQIMKTLTPIGIPMVANSRGAVAILAGFVLVVLLGFAALVIDIGMGLVTRNQLQNVADGAALAGARRLGQIYRAMPESEQSTYQLTAADSADINAKVTNLSLMNYAAGKTVSIDINDIKIGQWDPTTKQLGENATIPPDAVRVIARRDETTNGPISTLFAGILGVGTLNVSAVATAALTGLGLVGPGKLEVPVGISEAKLDCPEPGCFCGTLINFSSTKDSCAGWTTFDQDPNTPHLLDILDQMIDYEYVSPAVQAGVAMLEFVGGNLTPAWGKLKDLYDLNKDANGMWNTTVIVYEENNVDDCENPNELTKVVGFAKMNITKVLAQPEKEIEGNITCNTIEDGRGGGSNLGVIGSIPTLVQ